MHKQVQNISSIDKQINLKQLKLINLKTLDKKPFLKIDKAEIPESYLSHYQWVLKFLELFLKNFKKKAANKKLEMARLKKCLVSIRLMLEKDGLNDISREVPGLEVYCR